MDNPITLSAIGKVGRCKEAWLGIHVVQKGSSSWHGLLAQYPELTRSAAANNESKRSTKHFIHTTPGPPVTEKPRRIAPDRFKQVKKEFHDMIQRISGHHLCTNYGVLYLFIKVSC